MVFRSPVHGHVPALAASRCPSAIGMWLIQTTTCRPAPQDLHAIMRAHPFGARVTLGPEGLDANHIPFQFDAAPGGHGRLAAHVARDRGHRDRDQAH